MLAGIGAEDDGLLGVDHLKTLAVTCRNLAQTSPDERTRKALLETASDYEVRAEKRLKLLGLAGISEQH